MKRTFINLVEKLRECVHSTDVLGRKPDGSNIEFLYRCVPEELCLQIEAALSVDNGGPAFPSPTANYDQNGQLTVRDYFASNATAHYANHVVADWGSPRWIEQATAMAYQIADSMLRRRGSAHHPECRYNTGPQTWSCHPSCTASI